MFTVKDFVPFDVWESAKNAADKAKHIRRRVEHDYDVAVYGTYVNDLIGVNQPEPFELTITTGMGDDPIVEKGFKSAADAVMWLDENFRPIDTVKVCAVDSNRGAYAPQYFVSQYYDDIVRGGWDDGAIDTVLNGDPYDDNDYWDAWNTVETEALVIVDRVTYTIQHDSDIFLVRHDITPYESHILFDTDLDVEE